MRLISSIVAIFVLIAIAIKVALFCLGMCLVVESGHFWEFSAISLAYFLGCWSIFLSLCLSGYAALWMIGATFVAADSASFWWNYTAMPAMESRAAKAWRAVKGGV